MKIMYKFNHNFQKHLWWEIYGDKTVLAVTKQKKIAFLLIVDISGAPAQSFVLYKNLSFPMKKNKPPKPCLHDLTLGLLFSTEKLLLLFRNSFKLSQSIFLLGVWIWDWKMFERKEYGRHTKKRRKLWPGKPKGNLILSLPNSQVQSIQPGNTSCFCVYT